MADIIVNMTDSTQVTSSESFGKALVFCTTKDFAYKEYDLLEGLNSLQNDFDLNTEVYKIVETYSKANFKPETIAIFGKKLDESENKGDELKKALNELSYKEPNWYRLLIEENTEEYIKAGASWVEVANKTLYTQLGTETEKLAEELKENGRVFTSYTEQENQRNDAGACGYAVTRVPGTFTFKFKNLKGCKADNLSPERLKELTDKHINCYVEKFKIEGMGKAQLNSSFAINGDYIDHTESMDYIKFKINCEIAKILMQKEKVPYSDEGIQMIASCVTTALNETFKDGVIRKDKSGNAEFKVEYPSIAEMNTSDVKNRVLRGIKFKYVESGAIEKIYINGEVVLNL